MVAASWPREAFAAIGKIALWGGGPRFRHRSITTPSPRLAPSAVVAASRLRDTFAAIGKIALHAGAGERVEKVEGLSF